MDSWSKENAPNYCETTNKLRRELEDITELNDHTSDNSITIPFKMNYLAFYCRRSNIGSKDKKFFSLRNAIKIASFSIDLLVQGAKEKYH
jgi:hypothetical protein